MGYCMAKGRQVAEVIKEGESGVDDNQKRLLKVLVVEHKDRLTRFGFNSIQTLLETQGRRVEVVDLAEAGREDLLKDWVAVVFDCTGSVGQSVKRQVGHDWQAYFAARAEWENHPEKFQGRPRLPKYKHKVDAHLHQPGHQPTG